MRGLVRGRNVLVVLVLLLPMAVMCHGEDPHPIQWALTLKSTASTRRKGTAVHGTLRAKILPGWHLYAMEQQPGGPTPTKIDVPDGQMLILGDAIEEQTAPIVVNDPNFNLETRYFENMAVFNLPLKTVSVTQSTLRVDVLYQTCNDRMCLPPAVAHVSAQMRVGR